MTINALSLMTFTFQPLSQSDIPLLFEWLTLPHISAWWRETRDYQLFYKKYESYITDETIGNFIIKHEEKSIGYIQWYDASTCPIRSKDYPNSNGIYGMDLFIADTNYLGKGYAEPLIKQFITEIIMPMNPTQIIIDPEISNTRAIHVYEKVEFKKTRIVQATDGSNMVTAQLMELDPQELHQ